MFAKYNHILGYGIALAIMLLLLKWLELHFLFANNSLEIYMGIIAVIFTAFGIWIALKLRKPKVETVTVEVASTKEFFVDIKEIRRLHLSKRELEVLQLMALGLSNQEIADRLFVSLNTIKTHAAQVFEKMDVKRRTQAVDMAKRLNIIP